MISVFLAPSVIAYLQEFSICNNIIFNPMKSVCVAFQPKKSTLFCLNITLCNNVLEYIGRTKYLGFMFNSNGQDDEDMLRQMRNLYIRSHKLLRTFHYCSSDVKLKSNQLLYFILLFLFMDCIQKINI